MKFPCRLDKFVSHICELPRSKVKAGIKKHYATVNGQLITKFDHAIDKEDHVEWQEKHIEYLGLRYYMLNKPQRCLTYWMNLS